MELGLVLLFTAMFAIMVGLGSLASVVFAVVMFCAWAVICFFLLRAYREKFCDRLDGGAIALMTMAVTENRAYNDPITAGRHLYENRFTGSGTYRKIYRQTHGSVRQIQTYFEKMTDPLAETAGMRALVVIGKFIQHLTLRYVVHACIAYTFWCHDMETHQAAGDSVAVYSYNWKRLTKESAEIAVGEIAILVVGTTLLSLFFFWLFGLIGISAFSFYAIILSFMIVAAIKRALFNPYFTAKEILCYVDNAQRTVLTEKLYVQLSHVSSTYRQLLVDADIAATQPQPKPKKRAPAKKAQKPAAGTKKKERPAPKRDVK